MKLKYLLFSLAFLITCCGSDYKYEFWDISKFSMKPDALQDKEEIKLLYTSRAPDNNKELEYYVHIIVISQKTGDTVNVLTTVNNTFSIDDKDKIFGYLHPDNPITKMILMGSNKSQDENNINQLLKDIKKVARDPEFDHIADNTYPTVIGAIALPVKNVE